MANDFTIQVDGGTAVADTNAVTGYLAPFTSTGGVTSFNTRTGAVTLLSSDVTGALTYTPVNIAGDTMTGKLTLAAATVSFAPINFGANGVAPTTPVDGDVWIDSGQNKIGFRTSAGSFTVPTLSGTNTFTNATLVFGNSTATSTTGVATGATTSGNTKTVNIGTGGVSGSTTTITIGSATSTTTTTLSGTLTSDNDFITTGGRLALYRSAGASYVDWSSGQSLSFRTTTSAGGAGASTLATIDSSGNLGLGVTPSAWFSTHRALQVNTNGAINSNTDFFAFSNNAFVNSAGNDIYLTTGFAGRYRHVASSGAHQWFTAPSGTAGTAITFTQAMTLDASGNLGVGVTPSYKLDVGGAGVFGSSGGIATVATSSTIGIRGSSSTTAGSSALHFGDNFNTSSRQWAIVNGYAAQGALSFLVSTAVNTNPTTSGTTAMTLDASGNLAVGTASAGARLDVRSTAAYVGGFTSATANTYGATTSTSLGNATLQLIGTGASGATTGFRMSQGGSFELYFGGVQEAGGAAAFVWQGYSGSAYVERMRLDASGNLAVGASSASARLDVASTTALISQYRNGTEAYTRRFAKEILTTSSTPVTIDVDTGSSNALFTITVNCMSYTGSTTYYNYGVGRGYLFPSGFGITYTALTSSGLTVALSYVNNTTVRVTITDTVSTTSKSGVCEIVVTST